MNETKSVNSGRLKIEFTKSSFRYLTIVLTKTGFKLVGHYYISRALYEKDSIIARYRFNNPIDYKMCFNSLCDNQYFHFDEEKLEEVIERIHSYDPDILLNPQIHY